MPGKSHLTLVHDPYFATPLIVVFLFLTDYNPKIVSEKGALGTKDYFRCCEDNPNFLAQDETAVGLYEPAGRCDFISSNVQRSHRQKQNQNAPCGCTNHSNEVALTFMGSPGKGLCDENPEHLA